MGHIFLILGLAAKPLALFAAGLCALAGVLAVASPRAFRIIGIAGNHWVDTSTLLRIPKDSFLRRFDQWFDLDHHIFAHCRMMGIAACAGALLLTYLLLALN